MNNNIQETKKIDIFADCNNNTIISNEIINITKMSEDSPLIVINYPNIILEMETDTIQEYAKKGIISCSEFYSDSNKMHFEKPIKRNQTNSQLLTLDNKDTINFDEKYYNEDEFLEFIFSEQQPITPPTLEEIYKNMYECEESYDIRGTTNYNNMHFCYYCKQNLVIPAGEITKFLNYHVYSKKYSKYLLIVFRLFPSIFIGYNILENKFLKKFILDYLSFKEHCKFEIEFAEFASLKLINEYELQTRNNLNSHIFENIFYQENLKYTDYIKCDSCKNYLCPMHIYLGNCIYKCCDICNKKWTICGWCKPDFNEEYACKYIHQK
jgi:hypothetical protein